MQLPRTVRWAILMKQRSQIFMKTLTIVAPAYNEEDGIADFYHAVKAELLKLPSYDSSIMFVVDGGTDNTFGILKDIAEKDPAVTVVRLSRNFGPQMAVMAGIDRANTDIIIMMDSDMQHPPELIPSLIKGYEEGNDVVYTLRERTTDLGVFRRLQSVFFYKLINLLSSVPITENACDFRLISRKVADVIRSDLRERTMFLRGLMNWIGFRQKAIVFTAARRAKGTSKLSLKYLLAFGLVGIVSFSKKPLRAAIIIGALFSFFGFAFAFITVIQYFIGQIVQPGFATIVVLLSVFGGVQLMFLGIIGEYIGAIFDEVKGRPRYIVEDMFPRELPRNAESLKKR